MNILAASNARQTPREIKIRRSLNRAIKRAFRTCLVNDKTPECRNAWSDVEELSSALYEIKIEQIDQDAWCREHPDDPECRVYDV
jgi:hypothetical protein